MTTTVPVSAESGADATTDSSHRRRLWSFLDAAMWTVAVVAAVGMAIAVQVFGVQVTRVLSPSMEPTFRPGDLVIIRPVDTASITPGDIPMLPDPDEPTIQYVHRATRVDASRPGEVWIVTKGDANPSEDEPVTVVTPQVPVVVASVPLSMLRLDNVSWSWSMPVLGVLVLLFLALLFLPERTPRRAGDPLGSTSAEESSPSLEPPIER